MQQIDIRRILAPDLFSGKTVFVTGGGSGINLGIALTFARLGAAVGICGRTLARLEDARALLEREGGPAYTAVADVRDGEALQMALDGIKTEIGPIDVLVCGAAGNFLAPAETMSLNAFKTVVDIDLLGTFNASRLAFEQLRETRGSIVFISAGQSATPYPLQAHVGAAKAGIDQLMRNLALEWGRFGIRVNSIIPGPIDGTEGVRRLLPGKASEQLARSIPLGRFGTAEEVGAAAAFLASPLASFVTGTALSVDGGQNLPGSGIFAQIVQKASEQKEDTIDGN
jgi:NAD(P)-dependent dehydrogenase (short-subunit alcohol dehydrogenase family)